MLDNLPVVPTNSSAEAENASWPAVLAVGSVVGVMVVALILSIAALVYSGTVLNHLATGSRLFLLGGALLNLVAARWGSMTGSVMLPQDTTSAVVAVTLAALLPGVAAADRLGTVIAYTIIAALIAGGTMLLLGILRLGDIARFVPFPVIGGFLAGTGWLLVVGATDLVAGGSDWSGTASVAFATAAVFGVILLLLLRHRPAAFVFPGMIVGGVVVFYATLLVTGTSVDEARSAGLLPMMSGSASGFPAAALGAVDWEAVSAGWVGFVTVILVSTLALLLNVTSLELIGRTDVDFDRELRTVGAGNLLLSLTGAAPGYHGLGATALAWRLGVVSRKVPVVVAAVCLAAAAGGATLVGLLPTPLVAGVLIMLGLSFITDWLWDGRRDLTGPEYILMVAIVAAVAALGFLAAVFLGMAAAGVLFAVTYSQFDPIRHVATGAERRSSLDRTAGLERILHDHGGAILLIELQGYLFFGSARTVVKRVRALTEGAPDLRYLILDLRRVHGTDSTALASFVKLGRLAEELACQLLFSDVPEHMAAALERSRASSDGSWICVHDLDHALEMAENMVAGQMGAPEVSLADVFEEGLWKKVAPYLEEARFEGGETVIDYGDPSVGLFLVAEGRVIAEIPTADDRWLRVRSSGPGAILGEMSLYLGSGRTARVRAEEPTRLYILDGTALAAIEESDPSCAMRLHRRLAVVMAERLSATNDTVRALLR